MRFNLFKPALMVLIPALGIGLAIVLASNGAKSQVAAEITTTSEMAANSSIENKPSSQDEEISVAAGRGPHVQTEAGMDLLERVSRFENAFFERRIDDTEQSVIARVNLLADDSYIQWLEMYFTLSEYEDDRNDGLVHRPEADPNGIEVIHTGQRGDEVWVTAKFTIRKFDAGTGQFVESFQMEHQSTWILVNNHWFVTELPPD